MVDNEFYDFEITDEPLNNNFQVLLVKQYIDKDSGFEFYKKFALDTNIFNEIKQGDYQFYLISIDNYRLFMQDKSVSDYKIFFDANYFSE